MKKKQENKSVSKKTLLSAIIVLIVCVAMLIGATFAWFTDSVSNTGNRIQAGTLKVDLLMDKAFNGEYVSIAGGSGDIFKEADVATNSNVTLWEPGKTQIVYLAVKNGGNLALKYNVYIDVTDEGLVIGSESGKTSLEYAIVPGATKDTFSLQGKTWSDIVSEVKAVYPNNAGDLTITKNPERITAAEKGSIKTQGGTDYFALAVHMKEDAGNEYQGKDVILDVAVVATQETYEEDGFGSDQYDKNADYPILAPVIRETKKATVATEGAAVTIDSEIGKSSVKPATETGGIQIKTSAKTDDQTTKTNYKMIAESDLARNIETKESTADSVTYNISYVYTETVEGVKSSYDVSEFAGVVTNEFNISTGLKGVKVTHSHGDVTTEMQEAKQAADEGKDGYFKYDSTTGKLTIWSSKYSAFKISFASDFVAAVNGQGYSTINEAAIAAKSGETILLLKDLNATDADLVSYKDFWNDPAKALISELKKGVIFEGANHTITAAFTKESTVFGNLREDTVVKNLTIKYACSDCSMVLCSDDTTLQNITTDGAMTWSSGNYGAFIIYPFNNNTLENCVNKAALQTTTGDTTMYTAVFFGYPLGTGTITLTDCKNEGSLVCGKAGLIAANWSYGTKVDFVLNNVKNCGTIQSTCTAFYGGAGAYNYCTSDYWDKQACLTFTFEGTKYTAETPTKWYDLAAQGSVIGEGGSFIAGPKDATLAIAQNPDGTYTITPATASGVDYYVVSVGVYFGTTYGSGRAYATETLASGTTTTTLKNLSFVTSAWVAENPDATYGTLAGNPIYTKNSVSYYYINDAQGTNTNPIAPEMISVSAYDANGKLIASAGQ